MIGGRDTVKGMGTSTTPDLNRGRSFAWTPLWVAVVLLAAVAGYGVTIYDPQFPDYHGELIMVATLV